MSDHDCTGCWRYNPETDREECIVCGAVRAPRVVTDGGEETCGRCGGSGQVTKMVAGRSGLVPCPDCDTVPAYALPDEVPDDPAARIEAIDERLDELRDQNESWDETRQQVGAAKDALREAAAHDLVDDGTSERLIFLERMLGTVLHETDVQQAIQYEREQLREEKHQLETYLEHVADDDDEPELVTDGGQLVSEPDADLDALQQVTCVNCEAQLDLAETARFARVGELESGWLCPDCDEALCDRCDGRGRVPFPIRRHSRLSRLRGR